MGYWVFFLALLLSQFSHGQVNLQHDLKFKVASVEVSQLACLQDRERPIGGKIWGPRKSSRFSLVLITKPSYLPLDDLSLQAYATAGSRFFKNSTQYHGLLNMSPTKDFLILTDKVSPQSWVIALGLSSLAGTTQIVNVIGAHIDREKGVEYELVCSF